MRAARIHEFSGTLQLDEVDEPTVGPGEVSFQARFVSVNPLDVWVTRGTVAGGSQRLPFVPGVEAAGEVDGRPVLVHGAGLGTTRDGLYRERAAVPEGLPIPIPEGVDPRQAAGMGVVGLTAGRLVNDFGPPGEGDRVLVLGASGGVGSLVIQLARAAGARVLAQTTSPEKAAYLEELGADRVVVADADELIEALGDERPAIVIDPLADGYTVAAVDAVAPFGRIVLYGASAGPTAQLDLRALYRKAVQLRTYSGIIEPPDRVRDGIRQALEALARGDMRLPIDEVLPLEKAAEAHRRILDRRVKGKLLLVP